MADINGDHSTDARQVIPGICKQSEEFSKHPSDATRNGHGRDAGHRRHVRRGSTDYDTEDEELDENEGNIAQLEDTSDLDEGEDPHDLRANHRASQKQPPTEGQEQDNPGAVNGEQLHGGSFSALLRSVPSVWRLLESLRLVAATTSLLFDYPSCCISGLFHVG